MRIQIQSELAILQTLTILRALGDQKHVEALEWVCGFKPGQGPPDDLVSQRISEIQSEGGS